MLGHQKLSPFRGLLLGPVTWSIFFIVSYLVSGTGCAVGAGEGALHLLIWALGGAAALVILLHGIACWRRQDRGLFPPGKGEDREARDFQWRACAILDGLSLAGVFMLLINMAITPLC